MNWQPWRWLRGVPGLLTVPRPEPAQQAQRILAIQRHIVLPARLVVVCVAYYSLHFSRWMDDTMNTYGLVFQTVQNFFVVYVLIYVVVAVSLIVIRRFPAGAVQWIVFVVGFVDGAFLGGLTVLTGGFGSPLYWVIPGMIVVNALSIPLATPQIVLNLALTGFFLTAGLLELETNPSHSELTLPNPRVRVPLSPEIASDLVELPPRVLELRDRSNRMMQRMVWHQLPQSLKEELDRYDVQTRDDPHLREALNKELSRILMPKIIRAPAQEESDSPAEPFVLRLVVLLMLTFCCYGVQLLAARQRLALEEQKEFVARTEQLRAAGRLAAEIAHKIKNPLGIINATLFTLRRSAREHRPPPQEQLQIIQEEVERSDRIITQIMGYAQLAEGRVEKLDVARELERAIQEVLPAATGLTIEVTREFAPALPPLWMQSAHFNEIFVNLLQNAREVLNGVGQVRVVARPRGERDVEVVVTDNGPGIPADKRERIFEPYFTNREQGTGLGLAIVKHNVELYGGTVGAESELGKGARFTVFFPARVSSEIES